MDNINILIESISESFGYSSCDLFKRHNSMAVSEIRQIIWYFMRRSGMLYTEIADIFGMTHSNVIYGVKRITDLRSVEDSDTMSLISKLAPFFTCQ